MSSSDKSGEDNKDALPSQVVDYYKKHRQNKQLNKYFSGATHYLVSSPETTERKSEIDQPVIIVVPPSSEISEPPAVSPSSSVTSNRRLEWDNGADIGYSNCHKDKNLHRSISLPTLSSLEINPEILEAEKRPQTSNSEGDSLGKDTAITTQLPQLLSSSSSSSPGKNSKSYLNTKIGCPEATSTPVIPMDIPVSLKEKTVRLSITKAISIDCFDGKHSSGTNKQIQTTIVENATKSVQTGDSLEKKSAKYINSTLEKNKNNQSIIVINCESDKQSSSSGIAPQSESENIASHCDSFEYLFGDNYDKLQKPESRNDSKDSKKSDTKTESSTDSSKNNFILAQIIEQNQSATLIGDVNKSINILQKLMKSKKYDKATKKRYIQKIVQKLIDSAYIDDSSASSELFIPKKTEVESVSTPKKQQKLPENVPWYPALIKPDNRLSVKVFSNEYLPALNDKKEISTDSQMSPKQKSIFTANTRDETKKDSSSDSYHSWKNDKTASEIRFEKQRGQGDNLIKYASTERNHQIQWINNEILYLGKLKRLLEKHNCGNNKRTCKVDSKKTTTVYMVSQNKYSTSTSSSDSSRRKYVIQTELESSTTPEQFNVNFQNQDEQKNYQVKEMMGKNTNNQNGKVVVADVEVTSKDNATNIVVTARKVPENLVKNGKQSEITREPLKGGFTFPRSKQEIRLASNLSEGYTIEVPLRPPTVSGPKITSKTCQCKAVQLCRKCSASTETITTRCCCVNTDYRQKNCCCTNTELERKLKKCGCTNTEEESKHKTCCCTNTELEPKPKKCCAITQLVATNDKCCCTNAKQQEFTSKKCCCTNTEPEPKLKKCCCTNTEPEPKPTKYVQTITEDHAQLSKYETEQLSTSSTCDCSSVTLESDSSSSKECLCCKRKVNELYRLKKQLSNKSYPFCGNCYRYCQTTAWSPKKFNNPSHTCNCYTIVDTQTLNDLKKTIYELNEMENGSCTCKDNEEICPYCCKLSSTGSSSRKKGYSYVLKFDSPSVKKKQPSRRKSEEVKIRLPPNMKLKKKSSSKSRKGSEYNLQDYLRKNRPNFIRRAESRRLIVLNSKSNREEDGDMKKLLFYQNNQQQKRSPKPVLKPKRLFNPREVVHYTRKNYKKLPEVQRSLCNKKKKELQEANRLIVNIFNRKLKENVLKGKLNFRYDVPVVNL